MEKTKKQFKKKKIKKYAHFNPEEHKIESKIAVVNRRYILEQEGKSIFKYDIYNCSEKLKGQLKIGDFT